MNALRIPTQFFGFSIPKPPDTDTDTLASVNVIMPKVNIKDDRSLLLLKLPYGIRGPGNCVPISYLLASHVYSTASIQSLIVYVLCYGG